MGGLEKNINFQVKILKLKGKISQRERQSSRQSFRDCSFTTRK